MQYPVQRALCAVEQGLAVRLVALAKRDTGLSQICDTYFRRWEG